ncbi:MAG: AMP-binding protein [Candidatus Hodarchaeales archaeon]
MQGNDHHIKPEHGGYDKIYSEFKLEIPEHFNFGLDVVDTWCKTEVRDKAALLFSDDSGNRQIIDYQELMNRSNQVANLISEFGLKKGDRAIIMLPRIPEWWYLSLGMIKAGIVIIPITAPRKVSRETEHVLEISEPKAIIASVDRIWGIEELTTDLKGLKIAVNEGSEGWINYRNEIRGKSNVFETKNTTKARDPMLIYFTSGTIGPRPRGVVHAHSHALAHSAAAMFWYCFDPDDLHWTLSTPGWAKFSWGSFFAPFIAGCTVFVHDCQVKFSACHALKLIEENGITNLCATSTAYRLFLRENLLKYDFSKIKSCTTVGEALNPSDAERWQNLTGLELLDGYGQTETTLLIANFPFIEKALGSLGKPVPGYKIAIIDEKGQELPPYIEGHLAVDVSKDKPLGLFTGYLEESKESTRAFKHGYYYTGDKGYIDDEGYFYFTGRADEIIKTSGYNVLPFEIESVLASHEAVLEAAILGIPDPVRGQVTKAYVVLSPGYKASDDLIIELQDHVKQQIAHYKYPRQITFVDTLPNIKTEMFRRMEFKGFKEV